MLWSDYLGTMKYLAARLQDQATGAPRQRVIIVIGDLCDPYKSEPTLPPAPSPEEAEAFSGITVKMTYPYKSERDRDFRPESVRKYWEQYFSKRGNDQVSIVPFDDPSPLISPSPVPKSPDEK